MADQLWRLNSHDGNVTVAAFGLLRKNYYHYPRIIALCRQSPRVVCSSLIGDSQTKHGTLVSSNIYN